MNCTITQMNVVTGFRTSRKTNALLKKILSPSAVRLASWIQKKRLLRGSELFVVGMKDSVLKY